MNGGGPEEDLWKGELYVFVCQMGEINFSASYCSKMQHLMMEGRRNSLYESSKQWEN